MKKYLIGISYHEPETYKMWENGVIKDYESFTGIFIQSNSKEEAIYWAEKISNRLFILENPYETKDWKSFGHFCWIEDNWAKSRWSHCLDFFQEIKFGQFPDYASMGSAAYSKWIDSKNQNNLKKYSRKFSLDLYKQNNQKMVSQKLIKVSS